MLRPIILCVDDSAGVLHQLRSELGRRYRSDFEAVGYRTPGRALTRLDRARSEGTEVALVPADDRMPGMPGSDLLARARDLHPSVRRVLLVDLGDAGAAEPIVRAMTPGRLHGALARDDAGYILTGADLERWPGEPAGWPLPRRPLPLETSMPGVFAIGDARHGSIKRVASAVGEGAAVIQPVHQFLREDRP